MARLSLSLLGTFEVTLAGKPITGFEYDKVRALLVYLAVEADHPHRREMLTGLLWPERPERRARQSLSQALFNLRHVVGDPAAELPFLAVTPQTLQFNPASDYWLDVTAFTDLLGACQIHAHDRLGTCELCTDRLQQAVALYQGNFLEGFSLRDSPAFEEWVVLTRERLHRLAVEAFSHLAGYFEHRRAYEQALHYAWRLVEFEPWQEKTHRQLMRLLALDGQRSAALAQYESCRRLLAEELGVEPESETAALFAQIHGGKLSVEKREQRLKEQRRKIDNLEWGIEAKLPASSTISPSFYPTSLFVDREQELDQLNKFLNKALTGQGAVAFVTGGPGRGKSALMQAFALSAQAVQPDLIVVGGKGNAYTGSGDPYLPFREILGQLTGDMEAMWAIGPISPENSNRLWHLYPRAIQVLLDIGPDLIGAFLSGEALIRRAATLTSGFPKQDWLSALKHHVERTAISPTSPPRPQADLFEQYSRVLRALAGQNPLLLLLDDLQWADLGSIDLLFHLGRRLEGSQILILGAYRPAEIAIGLGSGDPSLRTSEHPKRHPLEPLVNEIKRRFGAVEVDLSQAEGRHFVDTLLDTEPNHLSNDFRQTLYRQTGGHPLFTIELLRGLQERGDIIQDQTECWVEGPSLDWETLPARVEAVIAEQVARLPEGLRQILTIASIEGETFTAEIIAQVQAIKPSELVQDLSDKLERIYRLVQAQGVRQRNGQHLSMYRFRHFLFQKYLYQHLDPVERIYLHEAVAVAVEKLSSRCPSNRQNK